jgi:O-antigen ligase
MQDFFDPRWGQMAIIQMFQEMNVRELRQYFLPASYTVFLLGFFFFPSSKFLSNFYYLAVMLPFVILILMKKVDLRPLFSSRTFLLITIYLVYMFCTLFWADSLSMSDFTKYGFRVLYVLIFLSVTIHLTQSYPTFLQKLLVLLCWGAAGFAIVKIMSFYSQHPFPGTQLLGDGLLKLAFRPSSQFGIVALACTYLVLHQRTVKTKLIYVGLLLASLSYMLLAQSKGPLLSFTVSLLAWQLSMWLLQKENLYIHRNKMLFVWVSIFVVISVLFILNPEHFKLATLRKISIGHRLQMWEQLIARIKDALWFGHGLTADARTRTSEGFVYVHPHSVYLGTLLYGGIVGLSLLVSIVISALWQGFGRVSQPINLVAAAMVLYGALCIAPNGNMLIHHPKPFWLFFWFPVALVVASELPSHPLHGELETSVGRGLESAAVERDLTFTR